MSKQDKEQAGVLLRERILGSLLGAYSLLDNTSEPTDQQKEWIENEADQIIAKAREAVKGAGLTPQGVQDSYHSTPELIEKAKKYYGDIIEYFDSAQMACRLSVAEAQTQAILKALGG